jgi:hypothetical protein
MFQTSACPPWQPDRGSSPLRNGGRSYTTRRDMIFLGSMDRHSSAGTKPRRGACPIHERSPLLLVCGQLVEVRDRDRGATAPKPECATIVGRFTPHCVFTVRAIVSRPYSVVFQPIWNVLVDPKGDALGHGVIAAVRCYKSAILAYLKLRPSEIETGATMSYDYPAPAAQLTWPDSRWANHPAGTAHARGWLALRL